MKAWTRTKYGGPEVLTVKDVPISEPGDNDLQIQVRAASVNPANYYVLRGNPYLVRVVTGLFKPTSTRLGSDIAGVVTKVGSQVTQFKIGDEVFGSVEENFGREVDRAYGEFTVTTEARLVQKPANVSFEEAAAVPMAGMTAWQGLFDEGKLRTGDEVLITGASGGIGSMAVQIAKAENARVTAICGTKNVEFVRSLGADRVIDYTTQDYLAEKQRYDLFLDVAATRSIRNCRYVLKPNGRYVMVGSPTLGGFMGPILPIIKLHLAAIFSPKGELNGVSQKIRKADLEGLRQLLASGKLKPAVSKVYPFEQLPEAIAQVASGHTRGKIVISMRRN